jgi:hypothetical protein
MSLSKNALFPVVLLTVSLAAPLAASAEVAAGFAPGSLWISKTALAAGDMATLYTVAYNSTAETVAGDAVFSVDGTTLGTKHFSLAPGTTQILSEAWAATEGSHRFAVGLENLNTGNTVLAEAKSDALTVAVAAAPPPSAGAAAAQNALAAAPLALGAASTTLSTVQSLRNDAIATIENALAAPAAGAVLGTSTEKTADDSSWKTLTHPSAFGSYFSSAWRTFLTWMLYILTNDWLFWIAFVLILYIVLRLLLLMFRERRNRRE